MKRKQLLHSEEITLDKDIIVLRNARKTDIHQLQDLYYETYGTRYLEFMADTSKMHSMIESENFLWLVAKKKKGPIISSLIYEIDRDAKIAKTFAAIVSFDYRGKGLTLTLSKVGLDIIVNKLALVETVYATTRTVNKAPQQITEQLGFKKLGLFPNVRYVMEYETHCLSALFSDRIRDMRSKEALVLPDFLVPLYNLIRKELDLEPPMIANQDDYAITCANPEHISFEIIDAEQFINRRFEEFKKKNNPASFFYPFHRPNLMLVDGEGKNEVYIGYSKHHRHCVVMGGQFEKFDYHLINNIQRKMSDFGARYVEFLINARDTEALYHALTARFIPCAYYPAMSYLDGVMHDYVIFSLSREILDFKKLSLLDDYGKFLEIYYEIWEKLYIY